MSSFSLPSRWAYPTNASTSAGEGWKNIGLRRWVIPNPLKNPSHLPNQLDELLSRTLTSFPALGSATIGISFLAASPPLTFARFAFFPSASRRSHESRACSKSEYRAEGRSSLKRAATARAWGPAPMMRREWKEVGGREWVGGWGGGEGVGELEREKVLEVEEQEQPESEKE